METGFQFNRLYLLGTPLLSVVIPLLQVPTDLFDSPLPPIYEAGTILTTVAAPAVIVVSAKVPPFDWTPVLFILYGLGLSFFFIRFLRQLFLIRNFIRQNPPQTVSPNGIKIIYTQGQYPTFSFLNYLFWDNSQTLTPTEMQKILQHETVHITQKHSWDTLYLEILAIIFWFNPFVHLYKKALASTHEYIADAVVVQSTNQQEYTSLLVKQVFEEMNLSLGHYFSKSLTLKRMKMLQKNNRRPNRLKQLLALPVIGLLLFLFSFDNAPVSEIMDNPASLINSPELIPATNPAAEGISAPQFPGGETALSTFLKINVKYPVEAVKNRITGELYFILRIEKDGNFKLKEQASNNPFATEISRLVSLMPKWAPATRNGKPLAVDYVFPLQFGLDPASEGITYKQPAPAASTLPTFFAKPITVIGFGGDVNKGVTERVISPSNKIDNTNKLPQFPGGKKELQQFLATHTQYPATALKNKLAGQVTIQATIDADGQAGNFKTLHADNTYFEQEALSVLRQMPRWEPGLKEGKATAFTLAFPFIFALESKQNIPALRLPANRNQLYVQDAITIIGYSGIIPNRTFVKKSVTPTSNSIKSVITATENNKPAASAKVNTKPETVAPTPDDKIFTFVEQQPVFKGGEQELNKFIRDNLKYPAEALQKNISGLVVVQFTVDKAGNVLDPKIVKSLGAGTDEEAIRLVKMMPPFSPAKQNGRLVTFRYTLPILFNNSPSTPNPATNATAELAEPRIIFTFVEMQPQFPGGEAALRTFISKQLQYPQQAISRKTEGIVIVQFVVDTNGKIINPKVVKSLGNGLDEEALRVVKLLPAFRPARQNKNIVAFRYTLPIRFALATNALPEESVK